MMLSPVSFYIISLTLHLMEGLSRHLSVEPSQLTDTETRTQNAPAAAAAVRPTTGQPVQNYWDSTPDGERVHCALGFDPESDSPSVRGLNYVARSRSSPQYGYLLEVSVWPGLKDRLKREFSIGERSAAAEKKLEGERVHNLKGHLMGELSVLSP
ncbi:hypothetical protein FOZ63_013908, partial [Perkinsus olseni]